MFCRNPSVTVVSSAADVAGELPATITTPGEIVHHQEETDDQGTDGPGRGGRPGALRHRAGVGRIGRPQTGWEYSGEGGSPCGSGLPQSGFYLPSDKFVLTSSGPFANVMTIEIGPSVAAPQGAAPGTGRARWRPHHISDRSLDRRP